MPGIFLGTGDVLAKEIKFLFLHNTYIPEGEGTTRIQAINNTANNHNLFCAICIVA